MAKTCIHCDRPVFSNKCCVVHQYMRTDAKYLAQKNKVKTVSPIKSSGKPIKKVSDKRRKQNTEYLKARKEFFDNPENKYCAVFPHLLATDIHHMKSRENEALLDSEFWLAVSREGHDYIHANSKEAYEKKWSLYKNRINE